MPSSLLILPFHFIQIPSSSIIPHEAQQPLVTKFSGFSLVAGYDTPFGQTRVTRASPSPLKHRHPAFPAHPDKTSYFELSSCGNTTIQVSAEDDALEDVLTFISVSGMAGDLDAPYPHGILIKENRGRGVVFNLCGCGESAATSPAFHHGGSTSDVGAVVTWVTMRWPKSKIYVIGTALGAVIAAKTLGQWGKDCPISAVALISPVYDFIASCKAMEGNFVPRTVFNPAVGAFYAKLVKKNKDAFDLDHWHNTRPHPFPPSAPSPSLPLSPAISLELPRESRSLNEDSLDDSFMASTTRATSIFSSLPSPSTPGTSVPPTPSHDSTFCISPLQPASPVVAEHTPEIKAAIADSLKQITSRLLSQPLTKFRKNFVASTAHFLSGKNFMAETSAVKDLPNIRVPCLAINCADNPLMPGVDLPRSQVRKSPFVVMAVPKKGAIWARSRRRSGGRRMGTSGIIPLLWRNGLRKTRCCSKCALVLK